MTPELYFIYDSHCPWSYASSALLNELEQAYPEMHIHLWHCAYYDGSSCISGQQLDKVSKHSCVKFAKPYLCSADTPKDSTMAANLMAWLHNKQPEKVLPVLNALQQAHFKEGNPLTCKDDFNAIIERFKLSPPNKLFRSQLSHEAEYILADIAELQEFIGTNAFPALLLTQEDKAVLLNHSVYLKNPSTIVDAVKKELS
ncbi:MAG: protein-disulfide isomerase [Psychromonas sp.]|nr:protein-disulfide isomerase [Psychromonas sp.]